MKRSVAARITERIEIVIMNMELSSEDIYFARMDEHLQMLQNAQAPISAHGGHEGFNLENGIYTYSGTFK